MHTLTLTTIRYSKPNIRTSFLVISFAFCPFVLFWCFFHILLVDVDEVWLSLVSCLVLGCVSVSVHRLCCVIYVLNEPPHLEDVFARSYICDVHPLAVDVVAVCVPAAHWDTLLSHVVAGKTLMETWRRQKGLNYMRRDKKRLWCETSLTSITVDWDSYQQAEIITKMI